MKITQSRHGAIVPLFALLLPVMIILCLIAMNLSYMQLTQSELKIATDAAARAGCRAWSDSQDMETARAAARLAAEMNTVSGRPLLLDSNDNTDAQIVFGASIRDVNGGRYQFTPIDDAAVLGGALVSGVEVSVVQPTNLLLRVANVETFNPATSSIASQIDRDIALVIDRSISMTYYNGDEPFRQVIDALLAAGTISQPEADDARSYRAYSQNVLDHFTGQALEYAIARNATRGTEDVPIHSRWESLEIASEAFFQAIDETHPIEQVAVSSFSSDSRVDLELSENLQLAEDTVNALNPAGSTAIGDGLLSGLATLGGPARRQSAVPVIILFTDGQLNGGIDPNTAVQQVIAQNPNTVIHAVTFSTAADQGLMRSIANATHGEHFHANTRQELIDVFKRIAASVPTLLTQ